MKPSATPVEPDQKKTVEDCLPQFISAFRSQESNQEKLSPPSGFGFTRSGNLLLADDFNHRIQIYDPDHNLIKSFGSKGKNPGELHYPRGIAVDKKDNIFVADSWNHRVQKFDPEGNPLLTLGSCGEARGCMNEPYDVFIDPDENLLVVERYNHRIQIFDPEGRSKGWIGGRGTVLEEELAHIFETPKHLFNAPAFEFPTSIARDSRGNYLITDSGNHRIVVFDSDWNLLFTFGQRGTEPGQFEYPLCVSVGKNDLLYVADLNNDRIQVFTSTGLYLGKLKKADDSLSLDAPGLTAVDPSGTLYVGMTFDTRVSTFETSQSSQEDMVAERYPDSSEDPYILHHQASRARQTGKREDALKLTQRAVLQIIAGVSSEHSGKNYERDLLLNFSRLALCSEGNQNASLLLQGSEVFSRHLDAERQAVLATHEEWEQAALKHNQLLFAEQKQVLEQREDSTVFNKELFQAEIRDRTLFRKLRHQFYVYRRTMERWSEYYGNTINSGLSQSALKSCLDAMTARLGKIYDVVNHLLEAKEKNEKAMVESFGESQSLDGKWETFLLRSNTNTRIMDVLRQLHFEIRSLLANVKGAATKYPDRDEVENSLRTLFIEPQGSEAFLKILLGFQQEWLFYKSLEIGLKDLIDLWMTQWGTSKVDDPKEWSLEKFSPVPFDSEEMELQEIIEPFLIEGMPFRKTDSGVACGNRQVASKIISANPNDFLETLNSTLSNARGYEARYLEGLQQLEALTKQKQELETKLNRVNPQDKKSPITLQNNISVVTFQVSLLRRMVLTMEINEAKNLSRLSFGTSLWLISPGHNESPETAKFIEEIIAFQKDLENKIHTGLQERKNLSFEGSRLNGILNDMEENNDIDDLNRTLEIKDQVANIPPLQDILDATLNRHFKVRAWIEKILDFKGSTQSQVTPRMNTVASYPFSFSFANNGPLTRHLLQPYGMAQAPDGDFIVADYENHQVVRYSSQGIYKSHFGGWGNSPGFFKYPINVQVDGQSQIYVVDEKNTRIQKFTRDGKFLLSFGDRGREDQRLGPVFSLAIDLQDRIWVADPSHNRIQIYDCNGELTRSLQNENLSEPVSVCCLENGDVLVGDKSSALIKHISPDGNCLRELPREGLGFDDIYFMAQYPDHGIFLTDYWNNQILHLDYQLDVIDVIKNPGRRVDQFGKVGGLIIANNRLAVADFENFRIQVLECPSLRSGS